MSSRSPLPEVAGAVASFARLPRHVSFIPDGNRRWADARGLPRDESYRHGIPPAMKLFALCRELRIEEVSIYGFTKENVRRPSAQVNGFRAACTEFAFRAAASGAALLVVGDTRSTAFPDALRPFARVRTAGDIRVNFLVNYSWQWDLFTAFEHAAATGRVARDSLAATLGSAAVSRVDLVVRWGGRQRLSGFLPVQCAYADFYSIDTLWPDSDPSQFLDALTWYQTQDVTLGG